MPKVAIVILNWNGRRFLEQFMPQLIENTPDFAQIVVADNGSSDDSLRFLSEFYPKVVQIKLDKNYGFAEGYNRALAQLTADFFVLLNSDVGVGADWLPPLLSAMESDVKLAACQPKILSHKYPKQFEYAGAAGGFIDKYGYPFCRGRLLATVETDNGQYDNATTIFWASGACMMVRAKAWQKCGGLDGDFFAHMEEIDLCWRLQLQGYHIAYIPESTVFHIGGGTLGSESPFKLYLNFRNSLFLLFKNLPGNKLHLLFIRLILDGLSAVIYLFTAKPALFWAVLKAHLHFYKNLKILRQKRQNIQKNATTKALKIYPKSLVLQYFIRKKRRFAELEQDWQ